MNEQQAIAAEWKSIVPHTPPPARKLPFQVPAAYFAALPGEILQKIRQAEVSREIKQELSTLAPILAEQRPGMPYTIPESYFEQKQPQAFKTKMRQRPHRVLWKKLAVAAVMTGILATAGGIWLHQQHQSLDYQLSHIPDQLLKEYLNDHTDLINLLPTVRETEQKNTNAIPLDNDISNDAIEQYLENYSIDDPVSN